MLFLSKNFTLGEFTYSETANKYGVLNDPTATHLNTLQHTCLYCLEILRDLLNKYGKVGQRYIYETGSNMTCATFEHKVATSLTNCKPVVLHARTGYLGYYGGKNTGHYLRLDYINRTTDMVRIVDCNYNPQYYGVHMVTLQEAYNTIAQEGERYLIY